MAHFQRERPRIPGTLTTRIYRRVGPPTAPTLPGCPRTPTRRGLVGASSHRARENSLDNPLSTLHMGCGGSGDGRRASASDKGSLVNFGPLWGACPPVLPSFCPVNNACKRAMADGGAFDDALPGRLGASPPLLSRLHSRGRPE